MQLRKNIKSGKKERQKKPCLYTQNMYFEKKKQELKLNTKIRPNLNKNKSRQYKTKIIYLYNNTFKTD